MFRNITVAVAVLCVLFCLCCLGIYAAGTGMYNLQNEAAWEFFTCTSLWMVVTLMVTGRLASSSWASLSPLSTWIQASTSNCISSPPHPSVSLEQPVEGMANWLGSTGSKQVSTFGFLFLHFILNSSFSLFLACLETTWTFFCELVIGFPSIQHAHVFWYFFSHISFLAWVDSFHSFLLCCFYCRSHQVRNFNDILLCFRVTFLAWKFFFILLPHLDFTDKLLWVII